jgi:hypothetical protein
MNIATFLLHISCFGPGVATRRVIPSASIVPQEFAKDQDWASIPRPPVERHHLCGRREESAFACCAALTPEHPENHTGGFASDHFGR